MDKGYWSMKAGLSMGFTKAMGQFTGAMAKYANKGILSKVS